MPGDIRHYIHEYNVEIKKLHAANKKKFSLLPCSTLAHIGIVNPPNSTSTTSVTSLLPVLILVGHWSPTASMNPIRNPKQLTMGDPLNASTMAVQSMLQGKCVLFIQACPTKQVSKNNYDPPHTVIFKLFEPPLRVLLRAATKLVNNVIAICPNTGRICLRLMIDKIVLKNLKTERAHDHGAAWHTIEHDHTSPSRVQLVWPTEHIGNWMDKRRDKDSVLKSITTSLKIFEEGSFFIDQPSLIGLVSDLTTLSVNKRLFDGLTMTEVARKRKGNETLSTFESIELDRMVKRGKLIWQVL